MPVAGVSGVSLPVRWNGSSAELPPEVIIRAHLTAGAKLYAITVSPLTDMIIRDYRLSRSHTHFQRHGQMQGTLETDTLRTFQQHSMVQDISKIDTVTANLLNDAINSGH